jgi:hypothetical protein
MRGRGTDPGPDPTDDVDRWPALATTLLALQVLTAVAVEALVQTPW